MAVAVLPAGVDPDDLARSDPDALRDAVASAMPFLGFRVERALAAGSMSSPEGRARAAEDALAVIAEHPSDLVRDQYVMQVAERCRLEPDPLRRRLVADNGRRDGGRGGLVHVAQRPPSATLDRIASPETEALRLAIHQPETVAQYLDGSLFASERHLASYEALAGADTLHEAIAAADPGAADLLQRLAVEDSDAEPLDVVANLVRERTRSRLSGLVRDIDRTDDLDLAGEANRVRRDMELLTPPTPDVEALGRLVDWLSHKVEERA